MATRYYTVFVPNSGRVSLRWSRPFDTPAEARAEGKRLVDGGEATLAFVAEIGLDGKRVLPGYTHPQWVRKIVHHYLDLVEALEHGPQSDT